ncbi:MAG: hypothetical protein ACK4LB_06140 [Spirosomataceae bacterium]
MESFQFKSYHIRSMNAQTEEEKNAINQELKDLYASLSENEKQRFNEELQTFLIKELGTIQSMYQAAKEEGDPLNLV